MLDAGERATLELALEQHADWVIIDERIGRNMAEYLGLRITGTLGVLLKARQRGLIASFQGEVSDMRRQGIHYHPRLIERLASLAGE
jgi:predicted nucleic acid-binding protein